MRNHRVLSIFWFTIACGGEELSDRGATNDALGEAILPGSVRGADFNGDGYADSALGIPGATVLTHANAGSVQMLYGGPSGLRELGGLDNVVTAPQAATGAR